MIVFWQSHARGENSGRASFPESWPIMAKTHAIRIQVETVFNTPQLCARSAEGSSYATADHRYSTVHGDQKSKEVLSLRLITLIRRTERFSKHIKMH